MTEFDGEAFIQRFYAVWQNHDLDGIAEMFTDDAVFEASFGAEPHGERAMGKEAATRLAAAGFRDTTRIAASNVEMMRDVLVSNRDEVIDALARFTATLDGLAEQLRAADDHALEASLERICSWHRNLFERR